MTVMELLRGTAPTTGGSVDPARLRRVAISGAGAAAVGACVFVLPALLVWVAATESTVAWTSALGTGASLWLLGGGAHLQFGGATVTIVPLLFLGSCVWCCSRGAARATGDAADDRTLAHAWGLVHRRLLAELGAWVAGYAACALLWVALAWVAGPRPVWWTVVLPVLVVPVVAAGLALRRHVADRPELWGREAARPRWLPDPVRRGLRPGLEGVAALLGTGVLLVLAMIVVHRDAVSHLQGELAPGLVGGVFLVAAQAMVLPNLGLWAVSFLAGTGFSAVEGASVTWTGSRSSVLPLVPVFGALPEPGAFPGLLPLVVLVPVLVGAVVGWRAIRTVARLSTTRTKLTTVAVAVTTTAAGVGLLDLLGGAALGARRLSDMGAPALAMTLALLAETATGAGLVLAWDRWKLRR